MSDIASGRILVYDHEPAVAELARRYLARAGFEVAVEADPDRVAGVAAGLRPDAVVLDLSGPGVAAELFQRVAANVGQAPIVCLVAGGDAPGAVRLTRPFGPRVLVDAVAAVLRRPGGRDNTGVLRAGAVALDPRTRMVGVGERNVTLTATEFDLLEFLMGHPGRVFTREQLLDAAWDPGASAGSRTIDVHIAQLRAKLGEASPIRTVRGVGYAVDT